MPGWARILQALGGVASWDAVSRGGSGERMLLKNRKMRVQI